MLLNQLSVSYKCHSSIGNSLNLHTMIDEVLQTFTQETDAIFATFYLMKNSFEQIGCFGKEIPYDINQFLSLCDEQQITQCSYEESLTVVLFKLENGLLLFMYDKSIDLNFICSIYENLRNRLNISINSCLNYQTVQEKNLSLEQEVKKALDKSKEKEKQFFEQLKMAQMGELIGNIAHQWRQPLSVISTAISGLRLKKEMSILTDQDFYEYCDGVLDTVMYLSKTIDEFRDYIKESNREKEIIVQDRIKMALTMVESSYKMEGIQIIEEFMEPKPLTFRLILGELLQAMLPILNNAKEALMVKEQKEKWLKYAVRKSEYNIIITLEDNAGGIPESILDKIFNPYFTTKHQTQGTGIGLYTCYDIVVNHLGGNLRVENTSSGAKFFMELPLQINYVI
ncbi:sensor histidine kinase [Candidatus Marinarcus aquaticus]|uniref:histidine kinase n=1 Tax=Candidatus Marinarcus aquaticus TaxID=2044504 RepID=A0A4Q0XRX1_9BACT|nr:HAMP domain-containing sensor histidine kinase [Candidatus Marinarcus aquaticus]RXJ56458.1 hypothetical protein CRV04_08560 [Candidatus Marinarcus aquaticus]